MLFRSLGDIEAAFCAELYIDQSYIGAQLLDVTHGVSTGRHQADDADPLVFEQPSGGVAEFRVVIDDDHSDRLNF